MVLKTATLELEDDPGGQVVVTISPVPVSALFDIRDQLVRTPRTRAQFDKLAVAFVPFLVSWTFEIPLDAKGFASLDFNLALAIVNGWITEVIRAPLPLLQRSSDGDPSEAPAAPSP